LVMHRFPSSTMEQDADAFASALLMPAADIRAAFLGRRVDLALLAALKPEWKVAMQALLMRATTLGFVTRNQAHYLWKQINARRLRLREPPELDFEPEKPTVIETMISVHTGALGYSSEELAQLLNIHEDALREFYGMNTRPSRRPRLAIVK